MAIGVDAEDVEAEAPLAVAESEDGSPPHALSAIEMHKAMTDCRDNALHMISNLG
jgi:hypothetical protein